MRADFQSIRLRQSTWRDAQALMWRWGAWGHYDGTCDTTNCKYEITLTDVGSSFFSYPWTNSALDFLYLPFVGSVYELLGGHYGAFHVGFIVQDDTVRRVITSLEIEIPPKHIFPQEGDSSGGLVLVAKSRPSLRPSGRISGGVYGGNEQLADHPTYKVGRPSGCESCLYAGVAYSLQASPEDIDRFTNYDFSCFTIRRCRILEDLLPAAKEWGLYSPPWGLAEDKPEPRSDGPAMPCRTPVWALGRDATAVASVNTVSVAEVTVRETEGGQDDSFNMATVRLTGVLKGESPWPAGTQLKIRPYGGDPSYPEFGAAEPLAVGKNYLAILYDDFPRFNGPPPPEYLRLGPGFSLDRCGLIEDTPSNRAELQRGMALNDPLRVTEF